MKFFRKLLLIACLLLASQLGWAEIRLGIVGTEALARPPVDLLTAAFTGATNVALVERAEIDKVFREQALAATVKADFTRFGALLKADGLVLVQIISTASATNVAVRLVAVNSGVLLDGAIYPLPLAEPTQWAKSILARFEPWLPKLAVPRRQTVPLSIISLRAPVNTPAAVENEQRLTALLFHRLMAEREVLVLERRQLGKLAWEKELASPDSEAFWNGAYLIEGIVDRDGFSPQKLTIHARVLPPDHGPALEVSAAADRVKPAAVIDQLAGEILKAVRHASTVTSWNPEQEAARYEEQAAWALHWKSRPDAYAAADAAYALGRCSETVAAMKVQSLLLPPPSSGVFIVDWGSGYRLIEDKDSDWCFDAIRNIGWNTAPPPAQSAAEATEALTFYHQHCLATPPGRWQTNAVWLELGVSALQHGSAVLRHHYFYEWRQDKFAEGLPELRAAARRVYELLRPFGPCTNAPAHRNSRKPIPLAGLAGVSGPFWQERPQDAVKLYQDLLTSGDFAREHKRILTASPDYPDSLNPRSWRDPFWVGWTRADREQGAKVWGAFIDSLLNSTNRTWRAEGALLKLETAYYDADIAWAVEAYYAAVLDETGKRFRLDVDYSLNDAFDNVLKNKGRETLRRARLIDAWCALDFARTKHYLQTVQTYESSRTLFGTNDCFFSPAQARELIPVFDEYAHRFPKGPWLEYAQQSLRAFAEWPADEFSDFFAAGYYDPERLKQLFANRTFPPEEARRLGYRLKTYWNMTSRNTRQMPPEIWDVVRSLDQATTLPVIKAPPPMQLFTAARAFKPGLPADPIPASPITGFYGLAEHDDRVITGTLMLNGMTGEKFMVFLEFNLLTGQAKEVLRVTNQGLGFGAPFEVLQGDVYWIAKSNILNRCAVGGKSVRSYLVDASLTAAKLQVCGTHLFITSKEAICEFFPADGSLKLLASTRRRPAVTSLDSLEWRATPRITLQADGAALASFVNTNLEATYWLRRTNDVDWRCQGTLAEQFGKKHALDMGGASSRDRRFVVCLTPAETADGCPQLLLGNDSTLLPRWHWPHDLSYPLSMDIGRLRNWHYDGSNLWIAYPPGDAGENLVGTLLCFDPRYEIPCRIPLQLEGKPPPWERSIDWQLRRTEQGLLLLAVNNLRTMYLSGFWFLPYKDLAAWIDVHASPSRNLPRRQPELSRRFDKNGNGILDPDEIAAMVTDAQWQLTERQFERRRFMLTADSNGNNQLEDSEITAVLQSQNARRFGLSSDEAFRFFQRGPQDRNLRLLQEVLRDYDRNHNGVLEEDEAGRYFDVEINTPSIRIPYDLIGNQPPGAALPRSLLKYDRNGNGKLDPEEIAELKQDRQNWESAAAAARARTNAPGSSIRAR